MGWIEYIPNWILPFMGFFIFVYFRWSKWSNKIDSGELIEGPKTFKEWLYDQRQELGWSFILAALISGGEESTIDSLVAILIKLLGEDWRETLETVQKLSQKLLFIFFGACSSWIVEKISNRFKKKQ